MKVVRYGNHGGPEVLEMVDVEDPVPGPDEVVVTVGAASINRLDVLQRQGPAMLPGFTLPHTPGMDLAGTVSATGPGVDTAMVGQRVVVNPAISCGECIHCREGSDDLCLNARVIGASLPGGYAEQCVVPAANVLPIPDQVSFSEAATWPTAYSTAWHGLFESGRLSLGEAVLIHGASSGVTSAAIQLATQAGARVIVTGRSDEKLEHALKLGASAVINSEKSDVATQARALTGDRGVDLVFDHVGAALFTASVKSLRPRGRLVFCGTTSGASVEINLPAIYRTGIRLIGAENYSSAEFTRLIDHLNTSSHPTIIDREMPLSAAADGHRLVESGEVTGKLVLVP